MQSCNFQFPISRHSQDCPELAEWTIFNQFLIFKQTPLLLIIDYFLKIGNLNY